MASEQTDSEYRDSVRGAVDALEAEIATAIDAMVDKVEAGYSAKGLTHERRIEIRAWAQASALGAVAKDLLEQSAAFTGDAERGEKGGG